MDISDNPNTITENLIQRSGISVGMRVLDLGCGNGETSRLLAKVVGSTGEVVGVDLNESSLAEAREKLDSEGYENHQFVNVDISSFNKELGVFDAVFGRRVLMYVKDQERVLESLGLLLKSGGIFAFQESDSTIVPSSSHPLPLHEKVNGWVWSTVAAEGGNIKTGFLLPSLLESCGYQVKSVRAEAILQGQNLHYPLSTVVKAILPRIIEKGVATADEIDIDSLENRLLYEKKGNKVFVGDLVFSVLAVKL